MVIKYWIMPFQIDQSMESEMVRWLPPKLAPRVRCIVSAISNSVQHQHLVQMEPKPVELHVKPLAKKDCEVCVFMCVCVYVCVCVCVCVC